MRVIERNSNNESPAFRARMKLRPGLSVMQTTCELLFVVDLRFLPSSVLTIDLHVLLMSYFWLIESIHTLRLLQQCCITMQHRSLSHSMRTTSKGNFSTITSSFKTNLDTRGLVNGLENAHNIPSLLHLVNCCQWS
jgi:hypothetical protein